MSVGLRIDDLHVDYRLADGATGQAVRDVSLHIAPGESLALVGESGCGKSTIALAAARLLPENASTRGSVALGGTDVLSLHGRDLRRWWTTDVAMVFQDPLGALDPTMRVGAQVAESLEVLGADRREARSGSMALLDRVALDAGAVHDRYPHQLSGGQQQRVVIAMALAVQPRLLILDEPTTGLDATVERGVLALVRELRAELSSSVLYITHDLGLVPTVSERVAVLYAGEIVEHGPVGTVLGDPQHPYTRALLDAVPSPGRTKHHLPLRTIPGHLPTIVESPVGCPFAARCPHAEHACTTAPIAEVQHAGRLVRCRRVGELTVAAPADTAPVVPQDLGDGARPLVRLDRITKRYGTTVAVEDVSLHVGRGEVLGLVGASGSGKSTIARLLTGLTAPDAGVIRLDGMELASDVRRRPAAARLAIQMVFQQPDATLNPRHRVRAVLARAVHKLGGQRSVEALARECHLDPSLLDRRAGTLSGGQKQRVAIARAIAGDPQLVVCDEAVSALDVSVQAGILALLVELQRRRGASLLFISHDLGVVEYLADRVAVMHDGRVVDAGSVTDVLHHPTHPYTAELVAARSQVPQPVVDGVSGGAAAIRWADVPESGDAPARPCQPVYVEPFGPL